mgnify:FL=1
MPSVSIGDQDIHYTERGTGDVMLLETPFMWSNPAAFRTVADLFLAGGR